MAFSLKGALSTALEKINIFKRRSGSVLGIDIGSSAIKVVQLRREKGKAILETYGELSLGPYAGKVVGQATGNVPPDKMAEALTDVLAESNTTTVESGVSIPFSASLVTFLTLPALPQARLEKMIPIEARKYVPVPITEVTLDWFVVPGVAEEPVETTQQGAQPYQAARTSVLLVAIHNEVLQRYQRLMKAAGLAVSFYEIEIFAATRAALENGIAPVMVLDMGAASTKLYIIERGIVRLSHNIKKGSQDITAALSKSLGVSMEKAEKLKREHGLNQSGVNSGETNTLLTTDYIFAEANRVLLNYQKKYNKNISHVVLTGGGVLLKGFDAHAKQKLDADVAYADPFAKVESPAFLQDTLREAGPEFAVAVGVALRKLYELG